MIKSVVFVKLTVCNTILRQEKLIKGKNKDLRILYYYRNIERRFKV